MFPILETDRLILRQITDQDAEAIFACFSNDEVTRYYGLENMESIEQAISMIQTFALPSIKKNAVYGGELKDGTLKN